MRRDANPCHDLLSPPEQALVLAGFDGWSQAFGDAGDRDHASDNDTGARTPPPAPADSLTAALLALAEFGIVPPCPSEAEA